MAYVKDELEKIGFNVEEIDIPSSEFNLFIISLGEWRYMSVETNINEIIDGIVKYATKMADNHIKEYNKNKKILDIINTNGK